MADWKQVKKWTDDDDFRAYLVGTLKLQNADAVMQKIFTGPVEFAKGTRRLRYMEGTFYLESLPEPAPMTDLGVGKSINVMAIQARLQKLARNAKISVKLDKNMTAAVSLREWDVKDEIGLDIKLNPTKLRSPAQVKERVAWLEKEVG